MQWGWYPSGRLRGRNRRLATFGSSNLPDTGAGSSSRRVRSTAQSDYNVRSPRLPGGNLINAVLDRKVMGLADRGGGSGLVGGRWADLCSSWIAEQIGHAAQVPLGSGESFIIDRVARLDDMPRIAHVASKRGLQNPDLMIIGHRDGRSVVQAADAKFSVETARSKQVSPEVTEAIVGLGSLVRSLTGELTDEIEFVPGIFLSPDYPLTHQMMQGRQGIMRATVKPSEVMLVPVDPASFFAPLSAANVMPVVESVDDLPVSFDQSLLAGLYYFRLSRAAVGLWLDSVKPLLLHNDKIPLDEAALEEEARSRTANAQSAFDLILRWDADVDAIRARRAAVDQVTGLPVMTRDLRNAIAAAMNGKEEGGPSANQLRKRLGSWFRGELRAKVGPIPPTDPSFSDQLQELAVLSGQLAKQVPEQTKIIVQELIAELAERSEDDGHIDPVASAAAEA